MQAFIEAFSLERITRGAGIRWEKLAWLNGQWLRGLSDEAFADRVMAWGLNREALCPSCPLSSPGRSACATWRPWWATSWGRAVRCSRGFRGPGLEGEALLEVLQFALWRFEALSDWTRPQLVATVEALAEELGEDPGATGAALWPIWLPCPCRFTILLYFLALISPGPGSGEGLRPWEGCRKRPASGSRSATRNWV